MELDVHLTREAEEPWGFEFAGGSDHQPLTVDQVLPSSPAHSAGLQAGDVVARLGDRLTDDLSRDDVRAIVAESIASLSLGIYRGLYDPVLDDFDPIYESIDRVDSDLQSEPTEVPDIFLDVPNILDPNITDPSLWDSGYATRPLTETRSLTASPFVPNSKPYRPFSTEPLDVPSLDDPIILNPNYKDNFVLKEDLLRVLPLDINVEAKFKLPVSEKYDPDWDKKVRTLLNKCADGDKRDDNKLIEHELASYSDRSKISTDVMLTKQVSNMKSTKTVTVQESVVNEHEILKGETRSVEMKEEINVKKIEKTALDVVEESIKLAVSVAENIQKEIEEERASMMGDLQVEESEATSEMNIRIEEHDRKEERKQSISQSEIIESFQNENETSNKLRRESEMNVVDNKTTKQKSKINVTESEEMQERCEQDQKFVEEIKLSIKKDMEESIEMKSERSKECKSSGTFSNETLKSEGNQKAFMIGLQTIPHIKGFVQSSYHFDLLLRTFFVHLTDVMVALSRFILTQPTQELDIKAEKVMKEKNNVQSKKENKQQDIKQEAKVVEAKEETKSAKVEMQKEYKKEIKQTQQQNATIFDQVKSIELVTKPEEDVKVDSESVEIKMKSGAEMSQRTQRKSRELTQKMDAVITELENKTGIEDRLEVTEQRKRRSRSKSQIEEEVMSKRDPLEWLHKVDSRRASQERSDIVVEKGFSTYSECNKSKISETKRESRTPKVKPGKQMYVAIVESHVYTNEDAILEDQVAEISETASVQSSEEINAALESFEVVSTENVAMSNIIQTEEKKQAVEIITNALQEVVQEKQEVFEAVIDFKLQTNEQHTKTVMQESDASVASESTKIISASKLEEFKASQTKESKALAVQEEIYKTAAVEFVDVALEKSKEVVVETKPDQNEAISKQELLTMVAAETTELMDECNLESYKVKEIISKHAVLSSEENYKTAAENISEMILEGSKEEASELKVKEHQAVAKVESLAIAVAESTDVIVDDSTVETFESKELLSKQASVKSEETFKTAAVCVSDVTFETAEENHSELAKTSKVIVKEEAQHLAVAGIIEINTELCKEPKKTAQDEYASLKIVKEQIIDGGESVEMSSKSELNVSKSIEVDSSNLHQSISQSSYQATSQESSSVQEMTSSVQEISNSTQEMTSSVQESSISIQQNSKSAKSLTRRINTDLALNLERQISEQSDENINTPTPSTNPPTPLTDEYVFKLKIPLPKNQGTVVVEESPDREDPQIVKKGLVPYIETTIEEQIIYDPPLPTPPEEKPTPVYTKPGLKGGTTSVFKKEYIREIERKSSLLASAIDETIKSIEEYKEEVGIDTKTSVTIQLSKTKTITNGLSDGHEEIATKERIKGNDENTNELSKEKPKLIDGANETDGAKKSEAVPGFKPVVFNPEAYQAKLYEEVIKGTEPAPVEKKPYVNEAGEPLGTVFGIVDGLEDATVDDEVARELGKPGLTEEKIAELISGESEMLREAHVMGVDFQKIKPLCGSLQHSEVLKALNEELKRESELKKKVDEKKWTTFLQKPKRPVPKASFGCNGHVETEDVYEEPYTVKIVKQPKPKVAPDYKPEDFETGPLPWEQRALTEPVPSPVPPEEPILVPDEAEFCEAVDPLPESEVPDLEDTGIPLPPTPPPEVPIEATELPLEPTELLQEPTELLPEPTPTPELVAEKEPKVDMDQNAMMAEQLVNAVKDMVDPNAPLEQQLFQMRSQLAALAQLPCVIQQSLELLTRQLSTMGRQETHQKSYEAQMQSHQEIHENHTESHQDYQEQITQNKEETTIYQVEQNGHQETRKDEKNTLEEKIESTMIVEESAALKREQDAMIEELRKSEKDKKETQEKTRLDQESRQVKQRVPRVGKPRPVFGPPTPEERPLVLPGGRRWRGPKDAINEQMIAETIQSQSEILQGKVMGYESDRLPYDNRINFMKYEKPPVNLDHLQHSATYKMVHNMEEAPLKRTDLLTPVIAEADYRERCRSITPTMQVNGRM